MAVLRSIFSAVVALLLLASPSQAWLGCINGWCFWGFKCRLHPNVIGQQCQKLCIPKWMQANCPNGGRMELEGARMEFDDEMAREEMDEVMQASDVAEALQGDMKQLAMMGKMDAETAREIENAFGSRNIGLDAAEGSNNVAVWAIVGCGAAVVVAAVAAVTYAKKKAYVEAGSSAPLVL